MPAQNVSDKPAVIAESGIRSLFASQPIAAVCAILDLSENDVRDIAVDLGISAPSSRVWRQGPLAWTVESIRRLMIAHPAGVRVSVIAADVGRKTGAVYAKIRQLRLPRRDRRNLVDTLPPELISAVADSPVAPEASAVSEQPAVELPAGVEKFSPRKRLLRVHLPEAELSRFTAPATEDDLLAWFGVVSKNLLHAIQQRVNSHAAFRSLSHEDRVDAAHSVNARLLNWLVTGSRERPDVPRWLNYDPSIIGEGHTRPLTFFQYVHKEIDQAVKDFSKLSERRAFQSDERSVRAESDEEFDSLLSNDTLATVSMGHREVRAEEMIDAGNIQRMVERISAHYADNRETKNRGKANMATIFNGVLNQWSRPEICEEIQRLRGYPVELPTLSSWIKLLTKAANMFHEFGARETMTRFGVAA